MAWVAFDRAVRLVDEFGADSDDVYASVPHWRALRDRIHRDICENGWDPKQNAFTQAYGSKSLDASVLLMPTHGFLPPDDPRIVGTIQAIERGLLRGGFVRRYATETAVDGLPGDEAPFLACSFWLADAYTLAGRIEEAETMLERLLAVRNDVGLLAEEYDPRQERQLGNFPQGFSHLTLIHTATTLANRDLRAAPWDGGRTRAEPTPIGV
jgi:GH15 family glucan-1,4-alpha-glucosidase